MVKISWFVRGYRKIKCSPCDSASVASLLMKNKIVCEANGNGGFIISDADHKKVTEILKDKYEYEISETMGVYGYIKSIKYKRGLIFGCIISSFLLLFSQSVVWDVRIDGNSSVSDTYVINKLSESGLSIGSVWNKLDKNMIEADFLLKEERISWININRVGTVAYVEVMENENKNELSKNDEDLKYSNIVADADCVIEEITVKRGCAAVKVGDVVKKGDILIYGIVNSADEAVFCKAEGSVMGRVFDTVSISVGREYEKNEEPELKKIEMTLKFFNFPINIFKRYGNYSSDCDIIDDVKVFSLYNNVGLPITIESKYVRKNRTETDYYSDDELVKVASSKLRAKTQTLLEKADLIRIKTYGSYTDDGYTISSELVYVTPVGVQLVFYKD